MSAETVDSELDRDVDRELEACRRLVRRDEADAEGDLAAVRAAVAASLAAEKGVVAGLRERSTLQRTVLVVAVATLLVAVSALVFPRSDLAAHPLGHTVALMALLGGVAAVAPARLLRPLHRPALPVGRDRLLLVAAVLVPAAVALWPMHGHTGAPAGEGLDFLRRCAGCLAFGGALALPILLFGTVVRRARVDGPAVAALAGVAAGVAAIVILHVHCPVTAATHLLASHVALVPGLALVAALWRRRS
jgi:hypothetical protein